MAYVFAIIIMSIIIFENEWNQIHMVSLSCNDIIYIIGAYCCLQLYCISENFH